MFSKKRERGEETGWARGGTNVKKGGGDAGEAWPQPLVRPKTPGGEGV